MLIEWIPWWLELPTLRWRKSLIGQRGVAIKNGCVAVGSIEVHQTCIPYSMRPWRWMNVHMPILSNVKSAPFFLSVSAKNANDAPVIDKVYFRLSSQLYTLSLPIANPKCFKKDKTECLRHGISNYSHLRKIWSVKWPLLKKKWVKKSINFF